MKYRMFSRLWQGNDHKTFEIYRKKWCYILLLHQTTTVAQGAKQLLALCYIFLLHQTTTLGPQLIHGISCVISFFYTKPQQIRRAKLSETVVLYLSSTSNHNCIKKNCIAFKLCYIFLLHQTTTLIPSHTSKSMLCYIFLLHQTTTM